MCSSIDGYWSQMPRLMPRTDDDLIFVTLEISSATTKRLNIFDGAAGVHASGRPRGRQTEDGARDHGRGRNHNFFPRNRTVVAPAPSSLDH